MSTIILAVLAGCVAVEPKSGDSGTGPSLTTTTDPTPPPEPTDPEPTPDEHTGCFPY
jgi:hypothetical protein